MADAGVIQEFLVGLGFKVDEASQKRFSDGAKGASAAVAGLQAQLTAAAKGLQDLATGLGKAADDPMRKYSEAQRKLRVGHEELRKSVVELGRAAVVTATAFAAGVMQVAKNFEQLFYVAQRTGASVDNLTKLEYGFEQVGLAGDQALGLMSRMALAMKAQPGLQGFLGSLIGPQDVQRLAGNLGTARDQVGAFLKLIDRLADMAPAIRAQVASMFGIPQDVLEQAIANRADLRKAYEDYGRLLDKAGVNQDDFAKRSRTFMNGLRTIWAEFSLILTQAVAPVVKILDPVIALFGKFLEQVLAFNKAHPAAALAESAAVLAAGLASMALFIPRLASLLLILPRLAMGFAALNPWVLALAAAVALVIANWDKLAAYFEPRLREITAAFERSWSEGFKATFAMIAGAGKDLFDALAAEIASIDWAALSAQVGKAIVAGLGKAVDIGDWLAGLDWDKAGQAIGAALGAAITAAFKLVFSTDIDTGALQNKILEAFAHLAGDLVHIGEQLIKGLVEGIISGIPGLQAAVSVIEGILEFPGKLHEKIFGPTPTSGGPVTPAPSPAPGPGRGPPGPPIAEGGTPTPAAPVPAPGAPPAAPGRPVPAGPAPATAARPAPGPSAPAPGAPLSPPGAPPAPAATATPATPLPAPPGPPGAPAAATATATATATAAPGEATAGAPGAPATATAAPGGAGGAGVPGPAGRGAPAAAPSPPIAAYQGGGIVTINAHEGEMVLPEPISRGLQALIRAGSSAAGAVRQQVSGVMGGAGRATEHLGDWLRGVGSVPRVIIENVDDFLREEEAARQEAVSRGTPGAGGAGGAGGAAGAAGGAGGAGAGGAAAAPGEAGAGAAPGAPGGAGAVGAAGAPSAAAPTTAGGRFGHAVGAVLGSAQAAVGRFAQGGGQVVGQAIRYFMSQGWSHAQAAGIAANIQTESSFNPHAQGDKNRQGEYQAFGLGQWHPDRQANFQKVFGKDIRQSTINEQLAFYQWELTHSEKAAGDRLRGATTAAASGGAVSRFMERPGDREGEASRRGRLAERFAAMPLPEPAPAAAPVPPVVAEAGKQLVAAQQTPLPAPAAAAAQRLTTAAQAAPPATGQAPVVILRPGGALAPASSPAPTPAPTLPPVVAAAGQRLQAAAQTPLIAPAPGAPGAPGAGGAPGAPGAPAPQAKRTVLADAVERLAVTRQTPLAPAAPARGAPGATEPGRSVVPIAAAPAPARPPIMAAAAQRLATARATPLAAAAGGAAGAPGAAGGAGGAGGVGGAGGDAAAAALAPAETRLATGLSRVAKATADLTLHHADVLQGGVTRLADASTRLDRIETATTRTDDHSRVSGDTVTNEGDKNVTMNVTHNTRIEGGAPNDQAARYTGANKRIYGDMLRDLKGGVLT